MGVLKKHGHVARFCFAISATVFCLAAFIYVNDMDLVEIANNEWESNRTLVEFVWDADGNWSYRMDIEYKIRIPNDNEELEPIKKLAPDEVVKVVGVIQAMDGNMEEQVKELEEKATLVMKQIQQGHLPW
jgi:hypothetical protein